MRDRKLLFPDTKSIWFRMLGLSSRVAKFPEFGCFVPSRRRVVGRPSRDEEILDNHRDKRVKRPNGDMT
ncbi:MAG: hypothetical protein ACOC7K_00590 [bacterium]